eukprot:g4595.t1
MWQKSDALDQIFASVCSRLSNGNLFRRPNKKEAGAKTESLSSQKRMEEKMVKVLIKPFPPQPLRVVPATPDKTYSISGKYISQALDGEDYYPYKRRRKRKVLKNSLSTADRRAIEFTQRLAEEKRERERRLRRKRRRQLLEFDELDEIHATLLLEREFQVEQMKLAQKQRLLDLQKKRLHRKAIRETQMLAVGLRKPLEGDEYFGDLNILSQHHRGHISRNVSTPLFLRIEKRYEDKVLLPELHRRRKKLKELQSLRGSEASRVLRKEIAQHEKSYMKQIREEKKILSRKRRKGLAAFAKRRVTGPQSRSETLLRKEAAAEKARLKKHRLDKAHEYAAKVRKLFMPEVDPEKIRELDERRKRLDQQGKSKLGFGNNRKEETEEIRLLREREEEKRREQEHIKRQKRLKKQREKQRQMARRALEKRKQESQQSAAMRFGSTFDIQQLDDVTESYIDVMRAKIQLVKSQVLSLRTAEEELNQAQRNGRRSIGHSGRNRKGTLDIARRAARFRGNFFIAGKQIKANARQLGNTLIVSAFDENNNDRYTIEKTLESEKRLELSVMRKYVEQMLNDKAELEGKGNDAF